MQKRRLPSVRVPQVRGVPVRALARRPLGGYLGPNAEDAAQSLGALSLSATTSLITGLTIAAAQSTLRDFPGLLLFIPAAVGLRGNVFGPLGGRLSTAIRTGTFSWSWKIDSLLGQNVLASLAISWFVAVGLAGFAEVLALSLDSGGGPTPINLPDFVVVSVLGGMIASLVVLAVTLGLAVASARFGWDLDNVTAPLVSAAGDFITLPALLASTWLIGRDDVTAVLAGALTAAAVVGAVVLWRSNLTLARRIVVESVPVLLAAGLLSLLAGVTLEGALNRFLAFTVLLVMLPGFLSTSGALGGILSSRLATAFHLGLVDRSAVPSGQARDDIRTTFALAFPIYVLLACLAALVGWMAGKTSPGLLVLVAVAVSAGLVATVFVVVIAYYGTLAVVRFGLDPDNHTIPLVTASLDVIGALTFVGALVVWNVT